MAFSNGWLYGFKKRNQFKAFKCHGEAGDADEIAIAESLPQLRGLIDMYESKDVFNLDEFGLFFQQAPTITVDPAALCGRKKIKGLVTFTVCSNIDGTDRLPPLVVGTAKNPTCFHGRMGYYLGFDYMWTKSAGNRREVFFPWLKGFDDHIGAKPYRRALRLLDNASCH